MTNLKSNYSGRNVYGSAP